MYLMLKRNFMCDDNHYIFKSLETSKTICELD